MKKAAKAIIDELSGENKERIMFYIDKDLHTKFKKVCADKNVRMSNVIERLIENFLEDLKESK